ncbi:MAG: hypothetical protein IT340_07715, partial [Chloroflexi bacterium]|nr:hypothetical protein [Chloroflexota bacterium]
MLREAGITYARQQFAWNEIEPAPGVFVDSQGRDTWAKYDYLVQALAREGVLVLARIENTPAWARPGEDTRAHPFGPPADYDRYAAFVARVVERYPGRITAVQVWNEPNLASEWGGREPDPAAYTDLLRRTRAAVRAAAPAVTVIAAGLAPTDGLHPGAANDLLFLDGMYAAGARGHFDAMGVMVYGLGQSPDNRHVGLRFPINFSRPVLTREVMVRHGDSTTPVWATEYSWISVPDDWTGRESTWGRSLSEEQQAAYLVRGLERAREEWPWMGVMCVWAFRFVEATMDPADPQRHFAIVRDDFSPRPAYLALASRSWRDRATPGAYPLGTPPVHLDGVWPAQTLAGRDERLAGPGDRLRLAFVGDRVTLLARRGVDGGRLRATIDGQPVTSQDGADGPGSVSLRAARPGDGEIAVVAGLRPGPHTLELTAGDSGEVALTGIVVARERPYGWAWLWLHAASLGIAALGAWLLLRLGVGALGGRPAATLAKDWRRHAR